MARVDAGAIYWDKVIVLGRDGLFTVRRVDRTTIPEGWIMYEVRHSEDDWMDPVEIALGVLVNRMGTLLVKEPFELEPSELTNNAYLEIDYHDWRWEEESVRF